MKASLSRSLLLIICALTALGPSQPALAEVTGPTQQLLNAVGSNDVAQARAAIAAGADVNVDPGEGRTPLITAVIFTRPAMVKLLLEHGADPLRQAGSPIIGNAVTAAFFAMNGVALTDPAEEVDPEKHAAALEVLKAVTAPRLGLDLLVRRATTQKTALMMAAEKGVLDAVEVLLAAGADPNAANGGKYTALDYAVEGRAFGVRGSEANRLAVVRALLAAGARKERKGADGVTPAERAARAGYAEIASLLRGKPTKG